MCNKKAKKADSSFNPASDRGTEEDPGPNSSYLRSGTGFNKTAPLSLRVGYCYRFAQNPTEVIVPPAGTMLFQLRPSRIRCPFFSVYVAPHKDVILPSISNVTCH